MRHSHRTFRPVNKEDPDTCLCTLKYVDHIKIRAFKTACAGYACSNFGRGDCIYQWRRQLRGWVNSVCLFVCFSARYLKNGCS